jgi:hypothetical protein
MTPEVTKFLADSKRPWLAFYIVMFDGSFFPASTEPEILDAEVRRAGCAGFVGYLKTPEDVTQFIRPWGVETPEATAALQSAADATSPRALVTTESLETFQDLGILPK